MNCLVDSKKKKKKTLPKFQISKFTKIPSLESEHPSPPPGYVTEVTDRLQLISRTSRLVT